jgi:hypothetical protein
MDRVLGLEILVYLFLTAGIAGIMASAQDNFNDF